MMRSIFGCFKGENVFNGYFRERSGESACWSGEKEVDLYLFCVFFDLEKT
jgi:hypothetical protein